MKAIRLLLNFALIVLLVSSGCTKPNEPGRSEDKLEWDVKISNNFSDKEKRLIVDALLEWQAVTCNAFTFTVSQEYVDTEAKEFGVIKINKNDGHVPVDDAGWTWWDYRSYSAGISMIDDLPGIDFVQVIKHELGHAFWLPHYEGPEKTIMTAENEGVLFVQEHDAREFCKIHDCSEDLKICGYH